MTYRQMHPVFDETFDRSFGSVPSLIRVSLWNYIGYGISPGGFMTAVIENDFMAAMSRADSTWNGRSFNDLSKWLIEHAPSGCWGSREKMNAWAALSDDTRLEIMIEMRLRPSIIDILKGTAIA